MRIALAAAVAGAVMVTAGAADGKKAKPDDGTPKGDTADGGKQVVAKKAKDPLRVVVGGRVFYRAEGFRAGGESRLLQEVASARIEVTMRWQKWLRAVAEGELRGSLRDAYIRARKGDVAARAGQFKPPVSAIELESAWNLPTATRGLLHDVLTDQMQIAGRRPGLQGEWDGGGRWDPRIAVGVFAPTQRNGAEIPDATPADVNVAARAWAHLGPTHVGLYGESLVTDPTTTGTFDRYWVAGVDGMLDYVWCGQGVRAWGEVGAGSTGFTITGDTAVFVAARAIAAWRRGGLDDGERYIEPYGAFEIMDPDTGIVDDLFGEGTVGVNVGAWRRLRVALELTIRFAQRNVPTAVLDPSDDAAVVALADRTTLRLFVGAAW